MIKKKTAPEEQPLANREFVVPEEIAKMLGINAEDLIVVSKRDGRSIATVLKAGTPEMLVQLEALQANYRDTLSTLSDH